MTYPRNNKTIDALPNKDGAVACGGITGLKVRVSAKGSKVFYLYYYMKGDKRAYKYRIGSRKDIGIGAAVKSAKQLRAQIELGINPQEVEAEKRKQGMTLSTFLDEHYYKYAESHQKASKRTEYILKHNFGGAMDLGLMAINVKWIEDWRDAEIVRDIKPATINRAITALKAVLNSAVRREVIKVNPIDGLKRLKVDKSTAIRSLEPADKVKLLQAVDEYKGANYIKTFVLMMLYTGIRPNEAKQLTWPDIDFRGAEITVQGAYSKTGETRLLPISKKLNHELVDWRKECNSDLYVFPTDRKEAHIVSVQKPWEAVRKLARLEQYRLYDLRHTFATDLIASGTDIVTVSELMGHSDVKMTMVYVHTNKERKQSAVDSL